MSVTILTGDCRAVLATLPAESVQCVVTSPPYFGLRDYGVEGQIGLEPTPAAYVAELVAVFREVRRVLRSDGVAFLNLGDSFAGYHGNKNAAVPTSATNGWTNGTNENLRTSTANRNGLKPKDLIGIPWRVAFALQEDGWYLRNDIIWHKPAPMPESVRDRCTRAHEYVFHLAKNERYYWDAAAIAEAVSDTPGAQAWRRIFDPTKQTKERALKSQGVKGGNGGDRNPDATTRNARTVWTIGPKPFPGAHFATFPPALAERCIKAGTRPGDTVLDPFGGAGTVGLVAARLQRSAILIELNPEYAAMASERIAADAGLLAKAAA